jgi:L-ascorbate metabolism protein UlaG (beta-lactamase superfamily)
MPRSLREERTLASPQWRDGRFHNPTGIGPGLQAGAGSLARDWWAGRSQRAPRHALPLDDPRPTWARAPAGGLRFTWLGHSTVLLEIDGARILTDPVFGERASPLAFAGPRRFHPAPVSLDALPPLDAIVLSHDHYDHLCAPTLRQLSRTDVPIVTSLGVGARLEALGFAPERITELDWWEHTPVGPLRVSATPAQHFSGRGLGDRNQTLWSSWVIEGERHRVFFSGDTGLEPKLAEIGARFGRFDLVMLEIGAFHPAWGGIHLGPEQARAALDRLGGGALFPVHWGTFDLALHPWDEPIETLLARAGARTILTPGLGRAAIPRELEGPTPWWRRAHALAAPALTPEVG